MTLATAIEPISVSLSIGSYTFCAITLSAPGLDGGDPIDTTTLCNDEFVTKMAQTLLEIPDFSYTAFYDPSDWDTIEALLNENSQCVLTIPGYGTLTFYGYLRSWIPDEGGRGEGWTLTGDVVVTNVSTADGSETGPVWADE